ncbi:MAG: FtsX-like permease family protein, partial [Pedobacter sp.]
MFRNYFKSAIRNLLRSKIYSLINILGLSIGLACCMLIILYNNDEVSFDRFHKNVANIYRITTTMTAPDGKIESAFGSTGMMPGPTFKNTIPEVKDFLRLQSEQLPIKVENEVFDQEALYVDSNFFSFFTFPLLAGTKHAVFQNKNSVVVSESVAKKLFGTKDAVGRTIEIPAPRSQDNTASKFQTVTVTGVVPNSPQNSSINIQMLFPMQIMAEPDHQWGNFFLNTFVVLPSDVDIKRVEAKFKKIYESTAATEIIEAREKYNSNTTTNYKLQPFLDMHLNTEFIASNGLTNASNPMYTKILGSIALFILLIASINFVNLSMARSIKRAKEIGVRKVIGGGRSQLIIQFLGESVLMSLCAFIIAIVLVISILPLFNSLSNKALSFSYLLDAKLIAGYVALFLLTSLLAGFYPALILSKFNPVQSLYNRMPLSRKNYLSKGLVVLQFALTTFLIIATITIYSQFTYLQKFDLGYNDKNLVIVNTDMMRPKDVAVFRHELT